MIRTIAFTAAAFAAFSAFAAPALAIEPVPGVDVSLGQVPGGIVASGATNAEGNISFPGLAPGTYNVFLADASELRAPVVVTVKLGDRSVAESDPIAPAGSGRGLAVTSGGARSLSSSRPRCARSSRSRAPAPSMFR